MKLVAGIKLVPIFQYAFLWLVISLPFFFLIGLIFKSQGVFTENSFFDLVFSSVWKPIQGKFGFAPFIVSSIYVTLLALIISVPLCLLISIFLTFYAKKIYLKIFQPVCDILAGIPSVVYGVWGILIIVPFISNNLAPFFKIESSGYSLLAGGLVLSVMIIPFILNIQIEIMKTVSKGLYNASISLGATQWQTIKFVVVRKAFPGLVSSVIFGTSRAFGETIAVLMVIGNVVKIPTSLFDPAYPLPALIANNYGEMLSIKNYDSALMFASLLLLLIVICFNMAARLIISRYNSKN